MDRLLSFYETQAHPRSKIQWLNNTNNGMTMGSDRLTMTTNNAEHLPFNEYWKQTPTQHWIDYQ
jgi:hypothetical protein